MVIKQYVLWLYNTYSILKLTLLAQLVVYILTFKSLWMMLCVCMCSTAWNNWNITCLQKHKRVVQVSVLEEKGIMYTLPCPLF